jgi:hypothetical protein
MNTGRAGTFALVPLLVSELRDARENVPIR